MTIISRDILIENKPASHGFITLLGFVCFQPRKFFRIMHKTQTKYSITAAILILGLLSFSAIQQADTAIDAPSYGLEDEYMSEGEFSDMDNTSKVDPGRTWMTGFATLGKQTIYWLVLTIVLSEVSLFKGKAPDFGQNLQIAVWSSLPFAIMAALQIAFIVGGGKISQTGFTGFLNNWQSYHELNPYLQSAVFALAAQFTFFNLWNIFLLYKGARESLRGNRIVVAFVLLSWFLMLTLALGFEHYQNADTSIVNEPDDYSYDEGFPAEESFIDEPLYPEGDIYGEDFP